MSHLETLAPLVEFACTGGVPAALHLAEKQLGRDQLFVVIRKLLELLRDVNPCAELSSLVPWHKDVRQLIENDYPEICQVLEIRNNRICFASHLTRSEREDVCDYLSRCYPPIVQM